MEQDLQLNYMILMEKIVSNKEVAITVNGVTYNKLTDSNGVAYLNINLNLVFMVFQQVMMEKLFIIPFQLQLCLLL